MIGVIGANGVAATNRLCFLVEEKLTMKGAYRDAHHPEMIIWQATQVPSRSMYLEGRGPSFIEDYTIIGKQLKNIGCNRLCMCCNTAHFAIEQLESKIGLPFINIINEVAIASKRSGGRKFGLMCSDGCRKTSLYEKSFRKYFSDAEIVYPDSIYQELVTKGICNAKNDKRYLSNNEIDSPYYCFDSVSDHLMSKGCDYIINGCTDINNVYIGSKPTIDSLEVLADKIISIHLNTLPRNAFKRN